MGCIDRYEQVVVSRLVKGAVAGLASVLGLMGCAAPNTIANPGPGVGASYGIITTYAGTGVYGYSGDSGPAISARMIDPICVALDLADNLYIGDPENYAVRKVLSSNRDISTYAGTGHYGYSGDGKVAAMAQLDGPGGCVTDAVGNLYLADIGNNVIRKISVATGVITTVAGTGYEAGTSEGGYSGDNGPALQAELNHPFGVAIDSAGDLYLSDVKNERIRRVDAITGVITTVAGNGNQTAENLPYTGDGSQALNAPLDNPEGLALDGAGNLYFADSNHNAIRRVDKLSGVITTVAGTGIPGYSGDGSAAVRAQLFNPSGVTFDSAGDLYISDADNSVVRRITMSTGVIETVVGTGGYGYAGDGGPAIDAELKGVGEIAFDSKGNMYIPDYTVGVVRMVTRKH